MHNDVRSLGARLILPATILCAVAACSNEELAPTAVRDAPPADVTVAKAEFSLSASASADELSTSLATDGTNALVAYQSAASVTPVRAKLVSSTGTVLASISPDRIGDPPYAAFDGQRYLMVWADHSTSTAQLRGVFVSASGAISGSSFKIAGTDIEAIYGFAFGHGKYCLTYRTRSTHALKAVCVSTTGVVGSTVTIATNAGDLGINNLATDGNAFVAIYTNGSNTKLYSRLVRADGSMGSAVLVTDAMANDVIGIGYTSGRYLVVWNKAVSSTVHNPWAQLVTQAGALSGSRFRIDGSTAFETGGFIVPFGSQFLVGYLKWSASANYPLYGRKVTATGTVGAAATLFTRNSATHKLALPVGVAIGSKVFFAVNRATPNSGATGFEDLSNFDLNAAVLIP